MGEAVHQVPKTIITKEYPAEYSASAEAYYPINNEENNKRYRQYKALADQEKDVIFGGRLAEYKYYDIIGNRNQEMIVVQKRGSCHYGSSLCNN